MARFPQQAKVPGRFGWREAALALLIVLLAYQVLVPFVMIIWTSLKLVRPGETTFILPDPPKDAPKPLAPDQN